MVNTAIVWHVIQMWRTILIYAALLSICALGLQWIEYQYLNRSMAMEVYIVIIGVGFAALGIWVGNALTSKQKPEPFVFNEAAMSSLKITKRELGVLEQLAEGKTNQEIADALYISTNTVKSHVTKLYDKLDVGQRVQAVQKARELRLVK